MNQKAINFCPEEKEDKETIAALTAKMEHGISLLVYILLKL